MSNKSPTESPDQSKRTSASPQQVPQEIVNKIVDLHRKKYGTRKIARRVGLSRKIVRRVLREQGCLEPNPQQPLSKLDPFRDTIEDKVKKGLTTSRILREIKGAGYQGGRTILAELVHQLRTRYAPETTKKAKRRFETRPAEEMQIDWSPYLVPIAGLVVMVHALGCLLCSSRKLFLHFLLSASPRFSRVWRWPSSTLRAVRCGWCSTTWPRPCWAATQ